MTSPTGWAKLQSSFSNIDFSQAGNRISRGFSNSVQATKERLGQVSADEITELPQEYKDLEARVDSLRTAHLSLLKIAKVYESETYDYPTQIQESLSEFSASVGYNITSFAATNLRGTNLPIPETPVQRPQSVHKTLPHALVRSASTASSALQATAIGSEDRLGKAFFLYATGWDKIANARVEQDVNIRDRFLHPWQTTLNTAIAAAMNARSVVKTSRLELDAAKQRLKNASPQREEQARIEVENAEDDLVQKTEVAITLMKTVLENPEPIKNLNELAKAQEKYFTIAAESLSTIQGDVEELSIAADRDYRKSRDH